MSKKNKCICIPRVEEKYSKEYILKKIKEFNIGEIISLKEIPLKKDPKYKRIIIQMSWDNSKEIVKYADDIFSTIGSLKLVYDMPWYWKVVESKFP
jgi:hypothetical protein